jgi:hypothetical protein
MHNKKKDSNAFILYIGTHIMSSMMSQPGLRHGLGICGHKFTMQQNKGQAKVHDDKLLHLARLYITPQLHSAA